MFNTSRSVVILALLAGLFSVTACVNVEGDAPVDVEALEQSVRENLELIDTSDVVKQVLVYHDGEPILEIHNELQPGHYNPVASITKSVAATLVGIAIGDGLIGGVDAPLGELLPSYADAMTAEVAAITLRDVLTHTAGFAPLTGGGEEFAFWEEPDEVRGILLDRAERGAGDGGFHYSDAGADIIGAVLVEATGKSVLEYAQEKLFEPMGIGGAEVWERIVPAGLSEAEQAAIFTELDAADFAWPRDGQGIHWTDVGLKLRGDDLVALGTLYLNGGRWDGEQLVPEEWIGEATASHVETGSHPEAYGYLWWAGEMPSGAAFYTALGAGGQMVAVVPDLDLVVTVLSEWDQLDPARESKAVSEDQLVTFLKYAVVPHLEQ